MWVSHVIVALFYFFNIFFKKQNSQKIYLSSRGHVNLDILELIF